MSHRIYRKVHRDLFVIYTIGSKPHVVFYDRLNRQLTYNPVYTPFTFDGWYYHIVNTVFSNETGEYTLTEQNYGI